MIAIIDYGIGNLGSLSNALSRVGLESQITNVPSLIRKASALVLPGVGAAGEGMKNLKARKLAGVLSKEINTGKPFLGICLGMQLLFDWSEEGDVNCLGVIKGEVKKFKKERKVPQIGWNRVRFMNLELRMKNKNNLFNSINNNSFFYFVNSYYCSPWDRSIIAGLSDYGEEFASIIFKNNIIATQFHLEKSGKVGHQFLKNIFRYFNDINH